MKIESMFFQRGPSRPELEPPTWEDIQRRGLHCTSLHWAVTMVRSGHMTREEALIAVALSLSRDREEFLKAEAERRAQDPPHAR